jgi:hypothetical protein
MHTEIIAIPPLLGNKVARQLIFTDDGLTIIKLKPADTTFIPWESLSAIRMKVTFIKGVYCYIGRQYYIDLKTDSEQVYTIRLTSLYNIKRKLYEQLWSDIYQQLYNFHFRQLLAYYLELHSISQMFKISGVKIYANGISWDDFPVLKWADLEFNAYKRYVVLHSRNGKLQRKFLYYGKDWNAWLLLEILKRIFPAKNDNIQRRKAHD